MAFARLNSSDAEDRPIVRQDLSVAAGNTVCVNDSDSIEVRYRAWLCESDFKLGHLFDTTDGQQKPLRTSNSGAKWFASVIA